MSVLQVEELLSALRRRFKIDSEMVFVSTKGDLNPDKPPHLIGSKGVFEKEVNQAVLRGEADVAVHSLKDVPTDVGGGLVLAAVLPRASPYDALVSSSGLKLGDLPKGSRVGTSSLRRRLAITHLRSDLRVVDLRGNVDTRVKKLRGGLYDAVVLAEAGLRRLGLGHLITQVFSADEITPAPGQGAIGAYALTDNPRVVELLEAVDDKKTRLEVAIERGVVKRVGGGCFTPIGVLARVDNERVAVTASLYSFNGGRVLVREEGYLHEADRLVDHVSNQLVKKGLGVKEVG